MNDVLQRPGAEPGSCERLSLHAVPRLTRLPREAEEPHAPSCHADDHGLEEPAADPVANR
eukprot:7310847-Alexandrium_andersonii.AAC.1